ncbi:hypothetical protein ACM26V_17270 [Salipaludibacillus sp. HK11]|uniref:hypothetical protein n=1 Tax=Salipaludibacillus sp. HK11 TaxID=3394320 RepID=UPI0039FBBC48
MTKKNINIVLSFILVNGIYLVLHNGHFLLVYVGISGIYPLFFLNAMFLVLITIFTHFTKVSKIILNFIALFFIFNFLVFWAYDSLFGPTYFTLVSNDGNMQITVEYTDNSFKDIHLAMNLYETTSFFPHKLNDDKIGVMVVMNQADGRPFPSYLGLEDVHWTENGQIHLPVWREQVTLNVNNSSSISGGEPLHLQ